jgi:hypothetical protein
MGTYSYLPGSSSTKPGDAVTAKPNVQMAGNPCHPMGVSSSQPAFCSWSTNIAIKLWTWVCRALHIALLFAPLVLAVYELAHALFSSSLPGAVQFFALAFTTAVLATVWLICYRWLLAFVYWFFWARHGENVQICRLDAVGILYYHQIWLCTTVMVFFANARLLDGTQLCAWFHRAMGAEIAGPVVLQMGSVVDAPFLKIGSRVTMDHGASLFSHQTTGVRVPIHWNVIGNDVAVDAFAHLVGNRVPNGTVWGTGAYLRFGDEIPAGGYYEGCQAERNAFRVIS